MKKNQKNRKGFSFIEAIVSIAIFIFILLALVLVYDNYSKVYNYQEAVFNLAASARATANEMQNAALQADHIVASHSFSGTTYTTDQDTLVLEIPSIDSQGDIVSGKYDYVVFYITGSNLYKRLEADAASSRASVTRQLSENIESVAFTYNNADLSLASKITADIHMQKMTRRQTVSYELEQDIYIRNL
jgi:type II secretory pathway pseudopilin PulG